LSLHHAAEDGQQHEVNQANREWGQQRPDHNRVPRGVPQKLDRAPQIRMRHRNNLQNRKGQVRRAEKFFAQSEKNGSSSATCAGYKK